MTPSRRRPALVPALALTLGLLLVSSAAGQSQYELPPEGEGPHQLHPEARAAMDRLKSPYCPGLMLEVCPSGGGAALRDSLDTMAQEGWSADSLVGWVLANHGEEWLALPEPRGAGLVAWLAPGLVLALGLAAVVVALRVMRARRPVVERERQITPEEEERLSRALRDLEAEEQASF